MGAKGPQAPTRGQGAGKPQASGNNAWRPSGEAYVPPPRVEPPPAQQPPPANNIYQPPRPVERPRSNRNHGDPTATNPFDGPDDDSSYRAGKPIEDEF
jgi:hypothetical protein